MKLEYAAKRAVRLFLCRHCVSGKFIRRSAHIPKSGMLVLVFVISKIQKRRRHFVEIPPYFRKLPQNAVPRFVV